MKTVEQSKVVGWGGVVGRDTVGGVERVPLERE